MSDSLKTLGAGDFVMEVKIKDKPVSKAKIANVIYVEGIANTSPEAAITIVDTSTENMLAKLPIRNGEKVSLKISTADEEVMETELAVYNVKGLGSAKEDTKSYILQCMSIDAMMNLMTRVEKFYKKLPPAEIVENILKEHLKTKEEIGDIKKGIEALPLTLAAMRDRPFDFITKRICRKSIPTEGPKGAETGTAGYTFWKTSVGYHFKSLDELMGAPNKGDEAAPTKSGIKGEGSVDTYMFNVPAAVSDNSGETERHIVQSIKVLNSNNIERQLYQGAKSNLVGFFDISSLRYAEEIYYMSGKNFKAMGHLADSDGSNQDLKELVGEDEWKSKPTRIMTRIFNNEMYENKDKKAKESEYDKIKQSLAQQIVRAELLGNQRLEINIPGNAKLHAGQKIILQIYKSVSNTESKEEDRIDKQQSGYYLISKVLHSCEQAVMTTSLVLIRDQNNEVTDD